MQFTLIGSASVDKTVRVNPSIDRTTPDRRFYLTPRAELDQLAELLRAAGATVEVIDSADSFLLANYI